jgi:hypothetical protein
MAQGTVYSRSVDPASADLRVAYEARVSYLARQCAELVEINYTLRRQRNAAQAELREERKQRGSR